MTNSERALDLINSGFKFFHIGDWRYWAMSIQANVKRSNAFKILP